MLPVSRNSKVKDNFICWTPYAQSCVLPELKSMENNYNGKDLFTQLYSNLHIVVDNWPIVYLVPYRTAIASLVF